MKKLTLLLLCIGYTLAIRASTSITTPTVSGHWTLAGSPYLIHNDITVASGSKLTIEPGVEIIFQGNFQMFVNGGIEAVGSASKPISFHIKDTTGWSNATSVSGGWKGIKMRPVSDIVDTSNLHYCNIYDTKLCAIDFYPTNLDMSYCNFYHNNGQVLTGFLGMTGSYTLKMSHCTIHDNIVSGYWGNMITKGTLDISECAFYNNVCERYLFYFSKCNLLLTKNNIHHNNEDGPAGFTTIHVKESNAVISGNSIHHNVAAFHGPLSLHKSVADITGNLITNNKSTKEDDGGSSCGVMQGGGGIRLSADGATEPSMYTLRNNVIANNTAAFAGGGIYMIAANARIMNNTIVNNYANTGGGIYMFNNSIGFGNRSARIKNNIFHNNYTGAALGKKNLYIGAGDTVQYDYNWSVNTFDIYSSGFGFNVLLGDTTTNVVGTTPPGFINEPMPDVSIDATNADFRLSPTSVCIDKGDTTGAYPLAKDFDNQQRIYGPKIDIGACEYSPTGFAHTGFSNQTSADNSIATYPNPASNVLFVSVPAAKGTLYIVDATGKQVIEKIITGTLTTFDVHALPRGIYVAVWNDGAGTIASQKIIVE